MAKHGVGAIPFFSKWLARRRVRKLERRSDDLRKKYCELSRDRDVVFRGAEDILTKAEFDRLSSQIDDNFEEACECVGAERKVSDRGKPGKPSEIEVVEESDREKCAKSILRAVFGTEDGTGKVKGKMGPGVQFRNPALNKILKECEGKRTALIPKGTLVKTGTETKADLPIKIEGICRMGKCRR